MADTARVVAEFDSFDSFEHALRKIKEARVTGYQAYGPINLVDVEDLMPQQWSPVRGVATIGAILGLMLFLYMCIKSSMIYDLIVGGKPPVTLVPYVIVGYEGTILLGALFAFFAVIISALLLTRTTPEEEESRFTSDRFGIEVRFEENRREAVVSILREAGAAEVDEC